ncbi:unannotated protein [freshwater metagenome]|uniref:Unannotated protein n=1 Tax=freshwater metagenome TaxID=449393 RepID=A0A6J7XXD0_9ZZZZ|nr:ATP-binding cassette domain-containing protein [Actinomycetota bacterium]
MKSNDLRLLLSRSSSRSLVIASGCAAFIWAGLIIANALLVARLIVTIIDGGAQAPKLIAILASVWAVRIFFHTRFEFWCSKKALEIKSELRHQVTQDIEEYAGASSTIVTTLLIKGFNFLDIYLGRFIPQSIFASVVPVLVIITMGILDPLSAIIAIVTLPFIPFFGALIGKYTADAVNKKWRSLGTLSNYFEDSLRGFVTLKIFGRDKTQSKRIGAMGDSYTKETMQVLKISFLSALALELCATISVALIAVSVGLRLVDSGIGFQSALAVLILAPEVYFPLRNAAALFHASADGSEALKELYALQSDVDTEEAERIFNFDYEDRISWNEWTLRIPHVSQSHIEPCTLAPGSSTFIVGESGIGKSTFAVELIHAAFESSWRGRIGWIPQDPQLASGTVRYQFQLLNPSISDEDIERVLNEVSLHIFDLPNGLDTHVGGAGEKVSAASGGQLKKIAIARALLRSPRLIIADEPSTDLDDASVEVVMDALRNRTTHGAILICVTHDLSLPELPDRVIKVERHSP